MSIEIVFSDISKTENLFQKCTGVIWRPNREEYDLGVHVNRSDYSSMHDHTFLQFGTKAVEYPYYRMLKLKENWFDNV